MVERGDTIEITDRGRPVALLGPIPSGGPLEELRRTGDIDPASADWDELPEPLPSTAARLPSEVLASLRDAER
jgi:antitoxin (DNA-binding transcriptional repressor) of toxin-antitoxin stability system